MKRMRLTSVGLTTVILLVALPSVRVDAQNEPGPIKSVVAQEAGGLDTGATPGELGALVNSFAGTGGVPWMCALDTPAATRPFGLVRLAPDTTSIPVDRGGSNRTGYYYGDNNTIGFSHTRLVGAWHQEGGHFRVFPTVASRATEARKKERVTPFSHREETAFPGYYAVRLPDEGVLAELTATPHVGVHRYTFSKDEAPHILVDVTSALGNARAEDGKVRILPGTQEIEGSVRTFGSVAKRYGGLDVFFVARASQPFAEYGTWTDAEFSPGEESAVGNAIGVDLSFAKDQPKQTIELRLAVSCVSVANARLNLDAETAGRSFDELVQQGRDAWEQRLSRIQIRGGTERHRRIFYTALYHAFNMPTVFNDVNGEYRGFDKAIHKAEGFEYYTDFSLWDTFRTVHPLYNLIARNEQRDMMVSLVEMAKVGGALPRWPAGCGYTNSMLGTPADMTIAEAYLKGVRGFDVEAAYGFMRQTALEGPPEGSGFAGREGLESYLALGYCASETMSKAVSSTLEFAWADHAISLLARELGHETDADTFADHARFYRNLWNPATQYFQPRDSEGRFMEDFQPLLLTYLDREGKYTDDYVEGSALQWRWGVPYDAPGLVSLFKSPAYFADELDAFFKGSNTKMGARIPPPYYWHGNQPDIHAAYLFNSAGRPDLTQKWVRWIVDNRYEDNYVGLDGNDDGGTLSSWFVLSALGFYPVAGTARYELGAPLFEKAEVRLGDKVLTIIAENHASENIYVHKTWLNDQLLDRTWFTHDEIANGGTLRFKMSAEPRAR